MGTKAYTSKGMVLVLACAAQFMVVLDVAIVNVALPRFGRGYNKAPRGAPHLPLWACWRLFAGVTDREA